MEDVLAVYHRPYDPKRPVVGMDELNKQLTREICDPLPPEPGKPQRIDYHYLRNGTANIFILFEPLVGCRYLKATEQHTKIDWAYLMRELIDVHYPNAEMVILVCDNLNTHVKASLYESFNPEEAKRIADKLEIHYTPKRGSWLNVAECELSHLSRQCLDRRIPDMETLKKEIKAWNIDRNNKAKPVDWQFTVENARVKLKRLYPQPRITSVSEH